MTTAIESFERSDTDGFLSQWASGLSGGLERTRAGIKENGGVFRFAALFEGNRRVKAKQVDTKFGPAWVLHEDEADLIERRGKIFLPFGSKSRVHKNLGLRQGFELAPAWACLGSEGPLVFEMIFRTGCKWGSDATEVS